MRSSCKGCGHYRKLSPTSGGRDKYCNYLLDTGEPRPCPAEGCTVKTGGNYKHKPAPMRVKA